MGVNEALAVVQKMGSLDRAEFNFDEGRMDADLTLQLPSLGVHLCFDGFLQDLRIITIVLQRAAEGGQGGGGSTPARLPAIAYGGRIFAGAQHPAIAFRDVYAMFGPTWIGDFKTSSPAVYHLRYPGLTFEFTLPDDLAEALAARGEHPMDIPGRAPPCVSQLWVYSGESPSFLSPASALLEGPEPAVVRPGLGVMLRGRMLRFGAMPQDVFSDFGPPEQVCVKSLDTVRIHSARGTGIPPCLPGPDYYYNYFHLGVDVLFDGYTHLVKKVILHANHPMHESFSRYARCFFQIPIQRQEASASGEQSIDLALVCDAYAPEIADGAGATQTYASQADALQPPGSGLQEGREQPPAIPSAGAGSEADLTTLHLAPEPPASTVRGGSEVEGNPASPGMELRANGNGQSDSEGDGDALFRPGRRMSKKERKARKKNRKKDSNLLLGAAAGIDISPEMSPLSSSPDPSPLQTAMPDPAFATDPLEGLDDLEGLPPALLAEGVQSSGEAEGAAASRARQVVCNTTEAAAFGLSVADTGCSQSAALQETKLHRAAPTCTDACTGLDAGTGVDVMTRPEASLPLQGRPAESGGAGGKGSCDNASDAAALGAAAAAVEGDALAGTMSQTIDVRWRWTEIREAVGERSAGGCGKPLVVSHCGGHTPFGSTYFYALPGLAFEVMQNDFISSLTLFSVLQEELPPTLLSAAEPALLRQA